MKKVLLVSFDFIREGEPAKALSSASILANLKHDNNLMSMYLFEHRSINMLTYTEPIMLDDYAGFTKGIDFGSFDFIMISAYIWNEYFLNSYLSWIRLNGFHGKIILGGYQITYADAANLKWKYPNAGVTTFEWTKKLRDLSINFKS